MNYSLPPGNYPDPLPPTKPILVTCASASVARTHADEVTIANQTMGERERHVREGHRQMALARAAQIEHQMIEVAYRKQLTRPQWLTRRLYHGAKIVLALSEVTAGAAAIYTAGDPLAFALPTFTGVGLTTVAAGTHIGIQIRRAEHGSRRSLVAVAGFTVMVSTAMLFALRYLAVGPVSSVLAFVTAVVALGSTFLGYQWHDHRADEVTRAAENHRALLAGAEAELRHPDVIRHEEAVATLRPAAAQALQWAYGQMVGPRSVPVADLGSSAALALPVLAMDDETLIDVVLVVLLGSELRRLTPAAQP